MIQLGQYPARQRSNCDVDWKNIPAEKWEMNFRPLRNEKADRLAMRQFLITTAFSAAIALGLIALVSKLLGRLLVEPVYSIAAFFGVVFFCAISLMGGSQRGRTFVWAAIANCLLLFFIRGGLEPTWQATFDGFIFLALILPFAFFVLDEVASNYVHWVSASPKLDRKMMLALRAVWACRFNRGILRPAAISAENKVGNQVDINSSLSLISQYLPFAGVALLIGLVGCILATTFSEGQTFGKCLVVTVVTVSAVTAFSVEILFPNSFAALLRSLSIFCVVKRYPKRPGTIQFENKFVRRTRLLFCGILAFSFLMLVAWLPAQLGNYNSLPMPVFTFAGQVFQVVLLLFLGPVLVLSFGTIMIGPVLSSFESLAEGEHALLRNEGWCDFDAYTDRLQKSSIQAENESIWIGFHKELQFPILLPVSLLFEHVHITGGSGSGKTARGLMSLVGQLVKRGEGPVIVIDGKGDESLFQSAKSWTEQEGRKFKWFTTSANKSTYLFNPLSQTSMNQYTLTEIVGFLQQAFNLFHGSDYGRAWFSQSIKAAMVQTLKEASFKHQATVTFRDFLSELEKVISKSDEHKAAQHVLFLIQAMAEFPQLNRPVTDDGKVHSACEHAIKMDEVINNNEVTYFSFESLTDPATTGELSRMVIYSAIASAMEYKKQNGKTAKITIVVDEAQNVAAKNIGLAIEQARSMGISFVFAHQSREQFRLPGGTDLRPVIDQCTQVKLFYSATDVPTVEYIQHLSGEVGYEQVSWKQFASTSLNGNSRLEKALGYGLNAAEANVSVKYGPRMTPNEIQDASAAEHEAIMSVPRKRGIAQYNGAFPIHVDYTISVEQFKRNQEQSWPNSDGETVSSETYWPSESEETIVRDKLDAAALLDSISFGDMEDEDDEETA